MHLEYDHNCKSTESSKQNKDPNSFPLSWYWNTGMYSTKTVCNSSSFDCTSNPGTVPNGLQLLRAVMLRMNGTNLQFLL